jgi:2-hydroxymuconate-semialdehyde hydrolase
MDAAIIREYISRELVRDQSLLPLEDSTPLLDKGILDSLSLLRLVLYIEEQFGIAVPGVDVVPEHFTSVEAICAYLQSRDGNAATARADASA